MKYFIILPMFLLILAGCSHKTENGTPQPTTIDISDENQNIVEIDMIAKQWLFEPDVITVNQGDTVKLHIQSIDVDHGIALLDFGVNEKLASGEAVDIEFVADKTGTFSFFCNVMCGQGHGDMTGQLIVE